MTKFAPSDPESTDRAAAVDPLRRADKAQREFYWSQPGLLRYVYDCS